MRDLGKILLYLVATVVLGALLAPPLFWIGQHISWLQRFDFQKFFNRSVLICALALIPLLVKWLGIRDWRVLGLGWDPRFASRLAIGFLASFLLMVALGFVLLELGIYRLKPSIPWGPLGKILLSAAVVSLIEEALFRGAILGMLTRTMRNTGSVIASSALFALVHFLSPPEVEQSMPQVRWFSGFVLAKGAFWQFSEPMLVLAGFTTLFLVGCILGFATVRTRSLWMAIGLHAGWIVGTMGFSKITKRILKDTLPWFGQDLSVGLGSVICVALTGALVWAWVVYAESRSSR